MEILEASLDDVPAAARLIRRAEPDRVLTPEGMLHFARSVPERAQRRLWKAVEGGGLIAWAAVGLNWESETEGDAYVNLLVDPEHRRRGIGSTLWPLLEERLAAIGAKRVSAIGAEEPASHAFATARGFRETFRLRVSRLELAGLPAPPPLLDGFELRPLSAYADDPRPVWELDNEATRDMPLDQPIGEVPFEEWLERYWRMPMFDFESSVVLLADGEPASFTIVASDPETRRCDTGMTGTSRRFRRRGYAELVKRHALARAHASGIEVAFTMNDETNALMLKVNERLGYRPSSARVTFSRP
jgi:GNAT superfamily N-acetyltransferase